MTHPRPPPPHSSRASQGFHECIEQLARHRSLRAIAAPAVLISALLLGCGAGDDVRTEQVTVAQPTGALLPISKDVPLREAACALRTLASAAPRAPGQDSLMPTGSGKSSFERDRSAVLQFKQRTLFCVVGDTQVRCADQGAIARAIEPQTVGPKFERGNPTSPFAQAAASAYGSQHSIAAEPVATPSNSTHARAAVRRSMLSEAMVVFDCQAATTEARSPLPPLAGSLVDRAMSWEQEDLLPTPLSGGDGFDMTAPGYWQTVLDRDPWGLGGNGAVRPPKLPPACDDCKAQLDYDRDFCNFMAAVAATGVGSGISPSGPGAVVGGAAAGLAVREACLAAAYRMYQLCMSQCTK
jgi:hypothetical protein